MINQLSTILQDGEYGKVLSIKPISIYNMDTQIPDSYKYAKYYEFIMKPGKTYKFYASVIISSQNGSASKEVWLGFKEGRDKPAPLDDGTYEWLIELTPDSSEFGWKIFFIDLPDSVKQTYGKTGWKYEAISAIRIRGELEIAQINLFE